MSELHAPLDGVKVVDLSRLLPGPLCTLLLADLGATVLKVEDPDGGDYLRWMPPLAGTLSGAFHALNRNKRSISVDLKNPEGREIVVRLLRTADILVDSFRPGTLERLCLGPTVLAAANARLIHIAISGFGATGPDRARAGHDLNYQAKAGLLSLSAGRAGTLHPPHIQFADIAGGAYMAVIAALAGIIARDRDGAGRTIDLSMTEGALYSAAMLFGAAEASGAWPRAGGETLTGQLPCYNVYEARDGVAIALAALEPKFWTRFCDAAGEPDLAPLGYDASDAAIDRVRTLFKERDAAEWIALGHSHDVCLTAVPTGPELYDDPQHQARGAFSRLDIASRSLRLPRPPLGPLTPVAFSSAPSLGADNDSVLRSLGYLPDEIDALRRTRAIGT